jgi:hypothetical protein
MRTLLKLSLLALLTSALLDRPTVSPQEKVRPIPGKFMDVTSALGIHFNYMSSHTAKHYLPETMGAGVALFGYDNGGLLDIFLVNGASILDPTPKGTL